MSKITNFAKQAHESASHISILREKSKEKELDTVGMYIHHAKGIFEKIENKTEIEGVTEEWYHQTALFCTLADFAFCAAHCHLSGSTTPAELAEKITDLYRRKNADYGDSFARSLDKYGIVAALVRISDKFNRLESLTAPGREAQVKEESILDTILDLASYAIMSAMWVAEDMEYKTIGSNSLGSKSR